VEEILPGIFHWTAEHPHIHVRVSSYWLAEDGVLIDPLVPPEVGLDRFEGARAVILSNRHHYRESGRFRERFGCAVHVPSSGLRDFGPDRQPVEPYDPGDELPGGLVVHEVGAICPDDMALHRPASRAIWFADGLVHGNSGVGFVIDRLMDEPEQTKQGLLRSFERILGEAEFDHVLFAHGEPVLGDGRAQLEELVAIGGRTAWRT
jgi:glyoxylase-like metal-dependent hydrolase (beta-lactamase superfamily II)